MNTFIATFFGVIASFLLWFGGQKWLQSQAEKKALHNMATELKEEIELNIALLSQLRQGIPRELSRGNVPHHLPYRLRLVVYDYIVKSGDIRLFTDFSKQRLIRYSAMISENFNHFIDNTETLLGIFILKSDGLKWARYRLEKLVEQAEDSGGYLLDTLNKLQLDKISEEESMVKRMAKYYIKQGARFIVWGCGIYFAILGILGQIAFLPQHSTTLIVVLYVFILASLIAWWFGIEKPPKKSE